MLENSAKLPGNVCCTLADARAMWCIKSSTSCSCSRHATAPWARECVNNYASIVSVEAKGTDLAQERVLGRFVGDFAQRIAEPLHKIYVLVRKYMQLQQLPIRKVKIMS